MSDQVFYQAIEDEIKRNLAKRYRNNGGNLNLLEVIDEASFCLSVNTIISERQISEATGGRITNVESQTIQLLMTGMKTALNNAFPNKITPELFQMLEKQYNAILMDEDRISIINDHYNNLFGEDGGNIL